MVSVFRWPAVSIQSNGMLSACTIATDSPHAYGSTVAATVVVVPLAIIEPAISCSWGELRRMVGLTCARKTEIAWWGRDCA